MISYFVAILALFAHLFLYCTSQFESEFLWPQIEEVENAGTLDLIISERIHEIRALNEHWRPLVLQQQECNLDLFAEYLSMLQTGKLALEEEGAGAAYTLYGSDNSPRFVIKPTDENIFCLHNPKHFASPFLDPRVKSDIPLYRGAQTDALCYELAKICGLGHITPKAVLALISHPQFAHILKNCPAEEKLCSIQEYLIDTSPLREVLDVFLAEGFSEEDLLDRFDQDDFEDIQLFLWITCDNDAHTDNFRVYPKKINSKGEIVYGLYKIDNSLALPDCNSGFSNLLMYFPNALLPLSSKTREKINSLPLEGMKELLRKFGLNSSIDALEKRILVLQNLLEQKDLTYYECSLELFPSF